MTKKEFVKRVAKKSGLPQRDAAKAVDAFLDSVTEAMKAGESVTFTGFGRFSGTSGTDRAKELDREAAQLREDAAELERSHEEFRGRLARSRQTLRQIAVG